MSNQIMCEERGQMVFIDAPVITCPVCHDVVQVDETSEIIDGGVHSVVCIACAEAHDQRDYQQQLSDLCYGGCL